MSEKAEHKAEKNASERAKSIWLAGLGAYGRAFDEAHDRYEKASKETSKLFENLVEKGKKLEDETQGRIKEVRTKSTSSVDERINKVKEAFGLGSNQPASSVDALEKKIDALSAKVDALLEAVASSSTSSKPKAKSKSLN